MKKLLLAGAAAAAAIAMSAPASAETYVGVGFGQGSASVEGIELNDASSVDLTVGRDMSVRGVPVRVEGRVARGDADILGAVEVNSLTYSATAFYDFDVAALGALNPYVGAGLQWTQGEVNLGPFQLDADGGGWHVATGFRANLTDRLTADVGYRHSEAELDVDFLGDVDTDSDEVRLGINLAI